MKQSIYQCLDMSGSDFKNLHSTPTWPQDAPYPWINPEYGTENQLTDPTDLLDPIKDTKLTQVQNKLGFYFTTKDQQKPQR